MADPAPELTLRPLTAPDLPLLGRWLAEPEVARWWQHDASAAGVERDFGPSVRGEEPGEDLVASLDGRAFGLLQRSAVQDYPEELAVFSALVEVPPGAVELDYLIGEPELRGHGLGTRLIATGVADTWASRPDVPAVLIAVVAANRASCRAAEKAGLRCVAQDPMPEEPSAPHDGSGPRGVVLHHVYRVDRPG